MSYRDNAFGLVLFCVKLYTVSPPLPLVPFIAGISLASKRAISFNPALFLSSGITASFPASPIFASMDLSTMPPFASRGNSTYPM